MRNLCKTSRDLALLFSDGGKAHKIWQMLGRNLQGLGDRPGRLP